MFFSMTACSSVADVKSHSDVGESAQQITNPQVTANNMGTCIKELSTLKILSIDDYNKLVDSFKEVSDINRLYEEIRMATNSETKELLKMSIESKTRVLCAQVKYYSVISTQSILDKADVL
ncbi:hypothetical protein [Wohlfahrtiimonas larvae]|uniref:hypothetical protein n=1 Tax=Wohlfahrtiimonas larvae TaxID=1157986 RepID=UPI00117F3466|nr:hypothetical protein [Wohlfahrtiimonas larvae]